MNYHRRNKNRNQNLKKWWGESIRGGNIMAYTENKVIREQLASAFVHYVLRDVLRICIDHYTR